MTDKEASTDDMLPQQSLPTLQDILLQRSLYDVMPVGSNDHKKLQTLREGSFRIDAYCVYCRDSSIFSIIRSQGRKPPVSIGSSTSSSRTLSFLDAGYFTCDLYCARCSGNYRYYFRMIEAGLSKVGQYPSIEDIGSGDLLKYRKYLSPQDYAELKRASGLFAHSIGIGSFVYLRRIFERLINEHRVKLEEANGTIDNFDRMGMDEKIKSLSSVLPSALVLHSKIYGIFSAGIHAMDEEKCRRYFPIVKTAILQILDQDIAAKQAEAAAANLEREITTILGELKSDN